MHPRNIALFALVFALLILASRPPQVSYAASYDGGADRFATMDVVAIESVAELEADLSISKSGFPDPVVMGQLLTYTLNVFNTGPSDATGVTLTDTLPASVNFVSATQGSCNESGGIVTCILNNVASATTTAATIRVIPTAIGPITNTAEVTGNESDPDLNNNTVTETTTVVAPSADLRVTKTDSPDPVLVGEALTYRIDVSNSGPSTATAVTLTDTLPVSVNFVSASSTPGGICGESDGIVTCNFGNIANASSTVATIRVITTSTGPITKHCQS